MDEFVDPEKLPNFCDLMANEEPSDSIEACGPLGASQKGQALAYPPSPNVERIDTIAPMPFLRRGKPATAFNNLKAACKFGAGFDFLAVCGDVMRERGFQSNKPGVASKSRHKCGQAFDYNQADSHLIIVSEPKGGEQYFRTWLKCAKQDGSQGTKTVLKDIRGFKTNVYAWDFTQAAESFGLERIPAWSGWQSSYTKKEFWHYQLTEGTTYEQAIDFLYKNNTPDPTPNLKVLKLGDKGPAVLDLQVKLNKLGFLTLIQGGVDGVFGVRTEAAVKAFQKTQGLFVDGFAGPMTRGAIDKQYNANK